MVMPNYHRNVRNYFRSVIIRIFKFFLLFCSVLSGILFAVVWRNYEQAVLRIANIHSPLSPNGNRGLNQVENWRSKLDDRLQQSTNYEQWLEENGLESIRIRHETLSYDHNATDGLVLESQFLANRTKVLCMVLSTTRHRSRALNNTWTKHCNQRWFYGSHHESKIPYVRLKLLDDSLMSPRTFCLAFIDLLKKAEDFHWLLITTDQTFAIVENLRYLVTSLNFNEKFYIGRPVHHYFLGVYNSHDSGIVLSRGTVDLLANTLFLNRTACINLPTNGMVYGGQFDSYIGMYLSNYGIRASNSYDDPEKNHHRGAGGGGGTLFHPYMPEKHLNPHLISVFESYWTSNILPVTGGFSCCSDHAITFTGFSPITMYFIEYVLYHLSPFTPFDGPKGLGNKPPPYKSYKVASDVDNRLSTSYHSHHHHHHHHHHNHHHHHYHHHHKQKHQVNKKITTNDEYDQHQQGQNNGNNNEEEEN